MTSTADSVLLEQRGTVLLITINRPDARNCVDAATATALGAALETLAGDDALRVGVLTGTGAAFCAGADLKALAQGQRLLADGHPEWGFAGVVAHPIDKPLIAAVNGFAYGGGAELVLAADLAVMAEAATLALPEVKHGLCAAGGGLLRLGQHLPPKIAAEFLFTGRPMDAATALRWGLVNDVVPADDVLPRALALAEEIAANAPLAVEASKRVLNRVAANGAGWDPKLFEASNAEFVALLATSDAREAVAAFRERRSPQWQCR
jgi:crotonobetainyl-CoA hydratase